MTAFFANTNVELLDVVSESTALFEQYEPLPIAPDAANDPAFERYEVENLYPMPSM